MTDLDRRAIADRALLGAGILCARARITAGEPGADENYRLLIGTATAAEIRTSLAAVAALVLRAFHSSDVERAEALGRAAFRARQSHPPAVDHMPAAVDHVCLLLRADHLDTETPLSASTAGVTAMVALTMHVIAGSTERAASVIAMADGVRRLAVRTAAGA